MSADQPDRLRLGLPKGSLQETTQQLFARAGFAVRMSSRSYYPEIDDPEMECILIRPQEMARYIEQGVIDCGITGLDWILESGADVVEMANLLAPWPNYGTVRWVLAVKEGSKFRTAADLDGKRIATEAVGLTKQYFSKRGIDAQIEFSWGATEVKPPMLADGIVDVSETGASLRANHLDVLDVVLESTPRLIASHAAVKDAWKKEKIDWLTMLLMGSVRAASRVVLAMNVPREALDPILALLPALNTPTVSTLADDQWVAVNTVVEEARVRELLPRLAQAGACGIIETPLNKIIS